MPSSRLFAFVGLTAMLVLAGCVHGPVREVLTPQLQSASVLDLMQRVADWQLAHPSSHPADDWTQGAGDAGFMALAGISANPRYRDAMLEMARSNRWQPGPRALHADDQCVGQTYTELYLLYRDPEMIAPLQARFDAILAHPGAAQDLDFTKPNATDQWSWCDALFMAPPTWARLYAATGDQRCLDYAVTNWWRTTAYLYDPQEHLFFRDSTYFNKREADGQKIFWSRGNGWVMGGLVRLLQFLPQNHPDRQRFQHLFTDMAASVVACQQPDGLWRASLLDPASYPLKETSGSGFYTYALAWGINQGLLDRAQYEPAVRRAWAALTDCVDADGRLSHVQPIGADPKNFAPDATEAYGVGAFLLAGSEVYRLAVLEDAQASGQPPVTVTVSNPSHFYRDSETVELDTRVLPARSTSWCVMDGRSSRILDSQAYSTDGSTAANRFLFQVDLAPGESRTFLLLNASLLPARPAPIVKTFARYVPERFDDFAWESDRIAHRIYGPALIKAEGTVSSGADVWIKKERALVVNAMYASGNYHQDNGAYMDDYRVGSSRGCGGLGIWDGEKLFISSNWKSYKLITTGPIRSEFELTYAAWDAGHGRTVSEVKRFSIDAGSWFTRAQCTLSSDDPSPLSIGVGLAERSCGPGGEELVGTNQTEGWMTYWQPEDKPKGTTATAIVLPRDSVRQFTTDARDLPDARLHDLVPQPTVEGPPAIRNLLAITRLSVGRPFTYYFGACWDRSGDFTNHLQWDSYVERFAERRDQPLRIKVQP